MNRVGNLQRVGVLAAMLGMTVVAAAANQPADPATTTPAPSPSPGHPLKVIGRVRALSSYCSSVIRHANGAIEPTLANDTRITFTVSNLRQMKPDASLIAKVNSARDLEKVAVDLHAAAKIAEAQVNQLRADVKATKDEGQKADLKEFVDALDGAVAKQKKIARQLGSYATYLDNHQPISEWDQEERLTNIMLAQTVYGNPYVGDPHQYLPYTLTELAKGAADRLVETQQQIGMDEGTAATHIEPALKNC